MDQQTLFAVIPVEKLSLLTKEELIVICQGEQSIRAQLQKDNDRLRGFNEALKQKSLLIEEQFVTIKGKLFGKSSERSPSRNDGEAPPPRKPKQKRVLLPSERYPHTPLIEQHITLDQLPECKCCGAQMQDSGLTEESEYLTKIPAQYYVVVQVRHKYACRKCHGDIKIAPAPPKIKEGSSYSNEMVIDVACSKYCDLIPIDRQVQMAAREGIKGLPPQSLIEATHNLADLAKPAYQKLKQEVKKPLVLNADESPHRMLEGDKTSNWFLWGFSTPTTSYYECHNTRSGDVASEVLINSNCRFLVSDVYSGYAKAVKAANKIRLEKNLPLIHHAYCNAHARRYFKQALERFPEAQFYINQYRKIYRLEGLAQKYPDLKTKIRARLGKYFEKIKTKCMTDIGGYSEKGGLGKALNYFIKNYDGLTRFLENQDIPIDNNQAERLLRSHVVGRKTWYGTHSHRGAETAAILFSLVESCKLNKLNPREYLKKLVEDLLQRKPAITPKEFKDLLKN